MQEFRKEDRMWTTYFSQYFQTVFPQCLRKNKWNYKNDLCIAGAFCLAEATKDEQWTRYILDSRHWLLAEDGTINGWKEEEYNIDKISFGKSLRIMRDLTGDIRYARAAEQIYGQLKHYPRTRTGNFWHKDIYPEQVWLDGLYMAMPFYAKTLMETGEDRWGDIITQFQEAHRLLWDERLGLYVHGCDTSRKADWADPVTGRSRSVWLRAEGWYLMALADVYELAQKKTPGAKVLALLLRQALEGIVQYQDKESKMFYQVVDKPELSGNYQETSGSAMVAYAMMKGARLGILDQAYGRMGREILEGISHTYLKKEGEAYHLYGICASAGLGKGPDPHNPKNRTGRPEYYVREVQAADNQHGAAACMMAVSEWLK